MGNVVNGRWFYEPKTLKSKCIHVVALEDWLNGKGAELCAYTLPSIKKYADKIGADFNLITKPRFPDFPCNYERFHIWEDGKDYQWNINIDADTLMHPEAEDPTLRINPFNTIGALLSMHQHSYFFEPNAYFTRNPNKPFFGDFFVVSSWLTHDIWEPLPMTHEEVSSFCKADKRQVSEFNLAVNFCKYDYNLDGALVDQTKHYHLGTTMNKLDYKSAIQSVRDKLKEWGKV